MSPSAARAARSLEFGHFFKTKYIPQFSNTHPVAVVPRFAPRVSGYALLSSSRPAPARGVSVEVKTEEDWMTKVTAVPTAIAWDRISYHMNFLLIYPLFIIMQEVTGCKKSLLPGILSAMEPSELMH